MHINPISTQNVNVEEPTAFSRVASFSGFVPEPPAISEYRRVFQTTDQMKTEFVKFLKTIFYQLDEEKVLNGMKEILEDPSKTDEEIYKELLTKIDGMKKQFAPLWQIWSLRVLKQGMGDQAATLLKDFRPQAFNDYMEIYDRRYLDVIRSKTGFPFKGETLAAADRFSVNFADRLQAGALFSAYPYKTHVPLNDPDCDNPAENPEKTCKTIGPEVADKSLDLIACLGGLHHISKERVEPFAQSLKEKLRPGAVLLMRDHNVTNEELKALVAQVHTFVNAADKTSWAVENKEIRAFKTMDEWTEILKKHGFTRISKDPLVLKDDPTENRMIALVRSPENLEEMHQAINYRNDCTHSKDGTYATWIEWGNVRFSKEYAEFVQSNHSYAFDYIGHLRGHWQHFTQYIKQALENGVSLKDLIFSDNFAMNLFILLSAAVQCASGYLTSLPSMLIARWQHGETWREVTNLSEMEKYTAEVEKEYSNYIDHTPFYMFDYIGKIKGVWQVVLSSKESFPSKAANILNAASWSLGMAIKALVSAPVRAIYTAEANLEPDTIKVLIKDPQNELESVIERFEAEKDPVHEANSKIEEIYSTPDGYKLISMPRYRPFTKICQYISETSNLELLEVGSQKNITVDLLLDQNALSPEVEGAKSLYEMDKLQDPKKRHYVTYQVGVTALKEFVKINKNHLEYIHE